MILKLRSCEHGRLCLVDTFTPIYIYNRYWSVDTVSETITKEINLCRGDNRIVLLTGGTQFMMNFKNKIKNNFNSLIIFDSLMSEINYNIPSAISNSDISIHGL